MSLKSLSLIGIIGFTGLFMLTSCNQADPRVTFCRYLAANLTQSTDPAAWRNEGYEIVRPEYAAIQLSAGQQRVVCYYEYDAMEESVLDHTDALDAYATLPYKMTLNGEDVDPSKLAAAIRREQATAAKAWVEQAQTGFSRLMDKIKQLF